MKKLVGFLTPKILDNAFTIDLAAALFDAGMDALELGVPFSDPVADGAIIEAAGHRALANGFTFEDILSITSGLRGRDLLWMGYTNPFYHRGMERVAKEAAALGVKGLIIPDLPHEEAEDYAAQFAAHDLALIEFVAPTTPADRIPKLLKNARYFIYLVAYAGVTGAKQTEDLSVTLAAIKRASSTPVFVGFGVNRATARARAKGADGVIVGSAFVKILLDDHLNNAAKIAAITAEARTIKEIINE
ncbi:tryptophan synthase alpha chain [Campylobacterota bacterium]|nr:tryptophan synthase alpha chain [Campylobacterota bacterium]